MDIELMLDELHEAVSRYQASNKDRIQAALDAGAALVALKKSLSHGDFTAQAERLAGVTILTAQRWMRLAKAELRQETVIEFGGIRETLSNITEAKKWQRGVDDIKRLNAEIADNRAKLAELEAQEKKAYAAAVEKYGEEDVRERLRRFEEYRSQINQLRDDRDHWITKYNEEQRAYKATLKRLNQLRDREEETATA